MRSCSTPSLRAAPSIVLFCLLVVSGARPAPNASASASPAAHDSDPDAAGGVAVCLAGRLRALTRTLGLFRENLLPALRAEGGPPADVFVYAPSPTAAEVARLGPLLEDPSPVRAVRFDDEGYVLEELGARYGQVLRKAMRIRGNWLGSVRREILPGSKDHRAGTGIFMMHAQNECLDMIAVRERRRGVDYGRVVFTRTDLRWIFPHPPLALLRREYVWIPDTGEDDWGGIYDKHLVAARAAAEDALGGWRLLTSGRGRDMILSVIGPQALRGNDTNTERWLAVRLLGTGLRVARFPMTAYVSCDPGRWVTQVDARVPGHLLKGFECSEQHDGRYPLEFAAVARFAECLRRGPASRAGGGRWSREAARRCYCGGAGAPDLAAAARGEVFPDRFAICTMADQQ